MTTDKALLDKMACEVYEAITGEKLHRWTPQKEYPYWNCKCVSCGTNYIGTVNDTWPIEPPRCASNNPDLINSLDAWREIWDCMSDEQLNKYTGMLATKVKTGIFMVQLFRATPLHHLEAALRMLGKWTKEMEG